MASCEVYDVREAYRIEAEGRALLQAEQLVKKTASGIAWLDDSRKALLETYLAGYYLEWQTANQIAFLNHPLGLVSFGIKGASESAGLDDRDIGGPKPRFTHHVTLKNLTPSTTYLFTVNSGGEIYQNNGEPFQQTTAPTTEAPPAVPEPVFGVVNKNDGTTLQEGLIYLAIGKNSLLSTYIDAGRWLITLNNARTQDLQNYIIPKDSDKVLLFVQAGMDGTSKIENIVANLRPVPILLQNTQDLPNIGLIKANLGKKGKGVVGDLNGDGVVNVVDFAIAVKKQLNLP